VGALLTDNKDSAQIVAKKTKEIALLLKFLFSQFLMGCLVWMENFGIQLFYF
jgi:hypothetical protein